MKEVLALIPKEDVLLSFFKGSKSGLIDALDYWINQDTIEDIINKARERREKYIQKINEKKYWELPEEEKERAEFLISKLRYSKSRAERDAKWSKQKYRNTDSGKYLIYLFESLSKEKLLNLFITQAKKEIY